MTQAPTPSNAARRNAGAERFERKDWMAIFLPCFCVTAAGVEALSA
eukprot:CAMPEP_0178452384 /NCGR_PEP_ID=MMETSP0689_2-20121128/44215_1 /TAXON_ID=160604 /ORGANISM="Amphidinium massartii, Strain CS-259" /LENGTH=45 /DNA_ID= /DNA_START= /DNA_END= /DNA_ORIENTATION=